jgi:hypothetical protein
MTQETVLMKIDNATFGLGGYQDAQLGLHLSFSNSGSGVATSYSYWDYENIKHTENARWSEADRDRALIEVLRNLSVYLKEAKVSDVSQLVGIPVEVTLDNNTFRSFRILTEVL